MPNVNFNLVLIRRSGLIQIITLFFLSLRCFAQKDVKNEMIFINDLKLRRDDYNLSMDGTKFVYRDRNHLFLVNLYSKQIDSIAIENSGTFTHNILNHKTGFALLSLNQRFIASGEKERDRVNLFIFDDHLSLKKQFVFHADEGGYIPEVDFSYVTLFLDTLKNGQTIFLFQDKFNYTSKIYNDLWVNQNNDRPMTFDPINGETYRVVKCLESIGNSCFESGSGQQIKIKEGSEPPRFYSVIDGNIIYSDEGIDYHQNIKKGLWNNSFAKEYNICRNYKKGLYKYENGYLYKLYLF